jgi:hydroxymethylpyrimidine pyrophosphatase-like HAD family hydrolase
MRNIWPPASFESTVVRRSRGVNATLAGVRTLLEYRPGTEALRAIYVDLDGTLLGPGGSLFATPDGRTLRAAHALFALLEAGVALVPVSGRTRDQMREAARILGAPAYIAELGAFLVEREGYGPEEVVPNLGAFTAGVNAFEAMARSGVGAFLLERYPGRLEPHAPWAFQDREATMLFRGLLDPVEATRALDEAGYGWTEVLDNGVISRPFESLEIPEVHAYHLVPRGVSKASAARLHMTRHALEPSSCAAVGDSPSDLDLAGEVGAVFIVANGVPAMGATADGMHNVYATPSPSGQGFAEAVETLLGRKVN